MSPLTADFKPRDRSFGISANPVRHWWGGDQPLTAIGDAFSVMLPAGERFFIQSLLHYEKRIEDPALKAALREFCRQEAFHTREHEDYNNGLRRLGYDVDRMEVRVKRALKLAHGPMQRLYVTCALEHLTTTFAATFLANNEWYDTAEGAYARLWRWHALEELEHRAVALDVANTVTGNWSAWRRYRTRIAIFNAAVFLIAVAFLRNLADLARQDGVKVGPVYFARIFWRLFGRPGLFRKSFWRFLTYYKPGFAPAREHDPAFIRAWQARIEAEALQAD